VLQKAQRGRQSERVIVETDVHARDVTGAAGVAQELGSLEFGGADILLDRDQVTEGG
jgi:hypothetical protein